MKLLTTITRCPLHMRAVGTWYEMTFTLLRADTRFVSRYAFGFGPFLSENGGLLKIIGASQLSYRAELNLYIVYRLSKTIVYGTLIPFHYSHFMYNDVVVLSQ